MVCGASGVMEAYARGAKEGGESPSVSCLGMTVPQAIPSLDYAHRDGAGRARNLAPCCSGADAVIAVVGGEFGTLEIGLAAKSAARSDRRWLAAAE